MHHAQYQGTMFAGAETRSTGALRSLLRGRGAHPATACASPSPSYSSSSSSDWWIEHYTQRLATFERLVTYWTSAALDEADDATMVRTHKRLADASAEVAKHRLLILHETARRIRPHSLVDTSGAVARGLPYNPPAPLYSVRGGMGTSSSSSSLPSPSASSSSSSSLSPLPSPSSSSLPSPSSSSSPSPKPTVEQQQHQPLPDAWRTHLRHLRRWCHRSHPRPHQHRRRRSGLRLRPRLVARRSWGARVPQGRASTAGTTGPLRPAPSSTSGSSPPRGTAALCADTARPPGARSATDGGAQVQPWSALALRQAALTPSTSCSTSAVLGIAQSLPLAASTEASSEHAESQCALTAPARDSASAGAQPQCPMTASPPPPLPLTLPAGPPRHGARCARQGGGGSVRSSTIVTILTVTRARRQVVGPTPKPRCRRQCGNAARAAALGLCSPPPSVKDGTGQGGRGSPAPDRTSARSGLRVGAADRPPPHSARRCLCRENGGYERVYSPTPARPSSRSRRVRGGHAQPYVRTRRGHPAKERRGPRGVDMHGQAAPTHKGPAAYLGSSWTAARFSHASSDAGEATWSPPLALSPLGKRSVRR